MTMTIESKKARQWSVLGHRAAFGLICTELAQARPTLQVLTADMTTSAGLAPFKRDLPEQFLDVGIAEQDLIGIAAGLASEGLPVIATTFAPFVTVRCLDQIRVDLGYMQHRVVLVGLAAGMSLGMLGPTHNAIEDVGALRSIPNIAIVQPADCGEMAKALEAALDYSSSVYIRMSGALRMPIVYKEDFEFTIGRAISLRSCKERPDASILATGTMVHYGLKAAELLAEQGVELEVRDMHTIKPLDTEAVLQAARAKVVVTIEEHNIIGGLGSAVAEVMAENAVGARLLRLGYSDSYHHAADYAFQLDKYGLTAEKIVQSISSALA